MDEDTDDSGQMLRELARTAAKGPVSLQVIFVTGALGGALRGLAAGGLKPHVLAAGLVRAAADCGLELPPNGRVNRG